MSGSAFAVTHYAFSSGAGRTSDGNGSHASTLKSPSYTKSVSWQHHPVCEHYYSLISQYREIHWVFMVSRSWYSQAVELLMCPTATLLSDVEPIENLVKTVRSGNTHSERISAMLTSPAMTETHDFSYRSVILTLSERKVLRLLGKGWGINQIASLLKKSNKTISAQKNSAMRRLAIHSNAEMYAWINSAQGARELNLPSVYGDAAEWNTAELRREMSHS